jgi:tetratricopeptide (TPR) repeat protein
MALMECSECNAGGLLILKFEQSEIEQSETDLLHFRSELDMSVTSARRSKKNTEMTRKRVRYVRSNNRIRHCWSFSIALGLCGTLSSVSAQFQPGEVPASPWANRNVIRQATNTSGRLANPDDVLRQPTTASQPTFAGADKGAIRSPKPASRPASVTLMGPVAAPKLPNDRANILQPANDELPEVQLSQPSFPSEASVRSIPKRSSVHATASPQHALTQNKPIEAQSDWLRVQAGGLILDDPAPELASELVSEPKYDTEQISSRVTFESSRAIRAGLADRTDAPAVRTPPSSLASSASSVSQSGPLRLTAESKSKPTIHTSSSVPSVARSTDLVSSGVESNSTPYASERQTETEFAGKSASLNLPIIDESKMQRIALAQRVSQELLSKTPYPAARAPEILESPPGWGAVEQELRSRLERCDSLLKRGAVLSARDEALQGLRRLCRTMDAHRRSLVSAPALEKALNAFREEADFHLAIQADAVPTLVASHSTEALQGRPLDDVSPEIASQHYRTYARYQLVIASDGHSWAADLLYAYGKTLDKEAEQEPSKAHMLRSQSVACYQAATHIAPSQSDAANQLGYALINLDRIDEAYRALSASIQQKPTENAWNNLAEIYRRRGAVADADYAIRQANAIGATQPKFSSDNPEVTEVDPATFAKYSPPPMQSGSQASLPPGSVPKNNTVQTASTSSSMFSKIFRK